MTVDAVSAPSSIHTGSTTDPAARKQVLDGEVFLKLLVTQLTHQDPSSPMDTNEMISQTTQLAMMEQLTALADSGAEAFALNMRQAASALIGQEASYKDADGKTVSGLVTKVSFDGPIPQVTIGDKTVALDVITGVTTAPTTPAPTTPAPTTPAAPTPAAV
ncbi:flagellar hook capping FlgD N-terminal domain-containing protein [Microbacterium foliorum]|uniref:flagellar hook capping FlgD N-terminal domain-containing protein n=1 Tax=Microbacterium foliorum TaxID=104336 RepID=UPI00099FD013|nr:flagellar hook capping FlgD N-terminal domain-containing protein [Microbacterium foliorum]AQY01702.1 flagellar hook capping protein [Microbacterium foliorum]